jgi:heptosyltransferase-2
VTPSAVIQAKRGIGDVIWHLPFVRAIAAASPGGKVTFLAPPSSGAKELLAAEPSVATTLYFEHAGSEFRRGINLIRLAALLRKQRFRTVWILDRTIRPALAARLAGVPERIGLGFGAQRLFITNAGVDESHCHDHPIDWLRALLAATNVPLPTTEPALRLPEETLAAVAATFRDKPRPWIVLGIAASHRDKDWPDDCWIELLAGLHHLANGSVFLVGGSQNAPHASDLIARGGGAGINACGLELIQTTALLRLADLFVGPNSGPMNLAAACGTQAIGLFGNTPVPPYSKFIHAVVPEGGPAPDGMRRITAPIVLERIASLLPS